MPDIPDRCWMALIQIKLAAALAQDALPSGNPRVSD
jgi:hypothetical protein